MAITILTLEDGSVLRIGSGIEYGDIFEYGDIYSIDVYSYNEEAVPRDFNFKYPGVDRDGRQYESTRIRVFAEASDDFQEGGYVVLFNRYGNGKLPGSAIWEITSGGGGPGSNRYNPIDNYPKKIDYTFFMYNDRIFCRNLSYSQANDLSMGFIYMLVDLSKDPQLDNPYAPGGDSGEGDQPPGTFDDNSDPIPDSSLPTISAANTGFTRIYNPTLSQVQDLARYLWTDETVIQTIWNKIKQYFEDPMQAIIGFNLVPVTVPNAGTEEFKLMYIGTGVNMTVAANQFVDVDCGSLQLQRYYGSALDQAPNTRVSCFLPYIGTVRLNTDEVMGTTLQVKYRVDIVSGSCVAKILVDGNCLYQYSGHCAITVPIGASDFSSYVTAAISVAKLGITAGLAGAGAVAAASTGEALAEQQTNNVTTTTITKTDTVRNPATGRQIIAGTHTYTETVERPIDVISTKASYSGLAPANIANTVGQVISSKPNIEHSGSFSGNTGYLGIRRPFIIIERPNMCMPQNYQKYNGFPCMITLKLGDCSGYTRVQQIQLTGTMCTNPEQAEILQLLKSGVII